MAQTVVSLLLHVIFSTKNRQTLITPDIEPELLAYMGGILKEQCVKADRCWRNNRSCSLNRLAV